MNSSEKSNDLLNPYFEFFIQGLIVYSTITMMLETMPQFAGYRSWFRESEFIVIGIFASYW